MQRVPFRHIDALKGTCDSFSSSLEDDIRRLNEQQEEHNDDSDQEVCSILINAHA